MISLKNPFSFTKVELSWNGKKFKIRNSSPSTDSVTKWEHSFMKHVYRKNSLYRKHKNNLFEEKVFIQDIIRIYPKRSNF